MKNKKAFTLIELLAVIVVLAIIALIATPIVMKTIKNAKKGAAERSADSYIKQVETAVATERLEGNVLEGEYTIQSDGDICPVAGCGDNNKDKVKIEVSGTKPESGTIKIENGQVTLTSTMDIGGCDITYDSENKKYVASEKGSTPSSIVIYRQSEDIINIGDTIDSTKYTTDPSTLGKSYYLKHVLDKDNKVTGSYACVVLDSKEYCLTNGEYGWSENEEDYTDNALILKKLRDDVGFKCNFYDTTANCSIDYVGFYVDNGTVTSHGDGGLCFINAVGSSNCRIL